MAQLTSPQRRGSGQHRSILGHCRRRRRQRGRREVRRWRRTVGREGPRRLPDPDPSDGIYIAYNREQEARMPAAERLGLPDATVWAAERLGCTATAQTAA
jgi:hypothetical protein